VLDFVRKH